MASLAGSPGGMALVVTEPSILVAQAVIFTTVAVHVLHGDNGGLPTAAAAKVSLTRVTHHVQPRKRSRSP